VVYGPYLPLTHGRYRAVFGLETEEPGLFVKGQEKKGKRAVHLEVVSGEHLFGSREITEENLKSGEYFVTFEIGEADEDQLRAAMMEARVWTSGKYGFAVKSVRVEQGDEVQDTHTNPPDC